MARKPVEQGPLPTEGAPLEPTPDIEMTPEAPVEDELGAGSAPEDELGDTPPGPDPEPEPEPEPEPMKAPQAKAPAKIKTLKILSIAYAGQSVGGVAGTVVFDSEGIAEVNAENYEFFARIPGYTAVE